MRRSTKGYEAPARPRSRLVQLAPDLAEGHIELGLVFESHDWNWAAADAAFRRALELAPGDAQRASRGGRTCADPGPAGTRRSSLIGKAVALDPLSAHTHRQAALIYLDREPHGRCGGGVSNSRSTSPRTPAFMPRVPGDHAPVAGPRPGGAGAGGSRVARCLSQRGLRDDPAQPESPAAESESALQTLINEFGWTAAYQVAEVYAYRGELEQGVSSGWSGHTYSATLA